MGLIKFDTENLNEDNKLDFGLVFNFEKFVRMAMTYFRNRPNFNNSREIEKILRSADFDLYPHYDYSFGQNSPNVNIKALLDDDDYVSLLDEKDEIEREIVQIFDAINPDKVWVSVELYPKSLSSINTENWREDPSYRIGEDLSTIDQVSVDKIWGDADKLHVFISHKDNVKDRAHTLKKLLDSYGVKGFVAHDDIEEGDEWLKTIEKAIFSSDALIALLTKDFPDSNWTDQEVGIAFGRQIPIFPVKMGNSFEPYGFMGKIQGYKIKDDILQKFIKKYLKDERTRVPTTTSLVSSLSKAKDEDKIEFVCKLLLETDIKFWREKQKENFDLVFSFNNDVSNNANAKKINEIINPIELKNTGSDFDDDIPF